MKQRISENLQIESWPETSVDQQTNHHKKQAKAQRIHKVEPEQQRMQEWRPTLSFPSIDVN